jgi:Fe-S cluster assembly protein SufB
MSAQAKYESSEYKYGFVTNVETETLPKGLSEDIVIAISMKKEEPSWLLDFRMKAYRKWREMKEPVWANIHHPPVDYQAITYYSAPKKKPKLTI